MQRLIKRARDAISTETFLHSAKREFFAWDCLAQFNRQMVHLVGKTELHSIWASVRAEVDEKVGGHRRQAVLEIALLNIHARAPQ